MRSRNKNRYNQPIKRTGIAYYKRVKIDFSTINNNNSQIIENVRVHIVFFKRIVPTAQYATCHHQSPTALIKYRTTSLHISQLNRLHSRSHGMNAVRIEIVESTISTETDNPSEICDFENGKKKTKTTEKKNS